MEKFIEEFYLYLNKELEILKICYDAMKKRHPNDDDEYFLNRIEEVREIIKLFDAHVSNYINVDTYSEVKL